MTSEDQEEPLVAAATRSRKTVNQDAFAVVAPGHASLPAVVVADGLGSHYGAEAASDIAARTIAEAIRDTPSAAALDLSSAFQAARCRIVRHVETLGDTLPPDLDRTQAFGTTAVCAVDGPDRLTLGYVGNGGLFHLRGNFNGFPKSQLLPWTALNYLNPHTVPEQGKNAMCKLVSPANGAASAMPTVLTVSKDVDLFGDIVVCVTDGVYSYDQTPMGRDSEHRTWISGERSVALLFAALGTFFAGPEHTMDALAGCLEEFLVALDAENLMSDDCTVGVLVTEQALRYQARRRSALAEATGA